VENFLHIILVVCLHIEVKVKKEPGRGKEGPGRPSGDGGNACNKAPFLCRVRCIVYHTYIFT